MVLSRQQVRAIDAAAIDRFGFSGIQLMENAGANAARRIREIAPPGRCVILCGPGNNGGDGFVVARHLHAAGCDVLTIGMSPIESLSADARVNAVIAQRVGVEMAWLPEEVAPTLAAVPVDGATVLVDCLLGTGATGPLRPRYREVVSWANAQSAMRIAIDVPTGMDCDTGESDPEGLRADRTLTMVASKIGFSQPSAFAFTGPVDVIEIGVTESVVQAAIGQSLGS